MHKKETDYDEEVKVCIESLLKMTMADLSRKEEMLYVDKCEEMALKSKTIKADILRKLKEKKSNKLNKLRCKTFKLEEEFDQREEMRMSKSTMLQASSVSYNTQSPKIKKEIFKEIGNRSEFMTDFTNEGRKYKYLINGKRINPWKSWYRS